MPVLDLLSLFVILLVLAVGLANFFYSHLTNPRSDIILQSEVSIRKLGSKKKSQSRAERLEGEFDYWLYFTANNRGDDNGYVASTNLLRLEFFDEENPGPEEIEVLEKDDLEGGAYGAPPIVIFQRELEGGYERGTLLVPKGEVREILVVLRIFSGEVGLAGKHHDLTRAVLEFEFLDSEGKYTDVVESEAVSTRKLGFPEDY